MKLLLIEDEQAMQKTLMRALSRLGWSVDVCGDGAQALQRWQEGRPDVVLLDLSLPRPDGLPLL